MASPQVLRWSALAFGVFYGFSHQRTITATQKADHARHQYESKQKLIDQAKEEFAKLKNPAPASADDGELAQLPTVLPCPKNASEKSTTHMDLTDSQYSNHRPREPELRSRKVVAKSFEGEPIGMTLILEKFKSAERWPMLRA